MDRDRACSFGCLVNQLARLKLRHPIHHYAVGATSYWWRLHGYSSAAWGNLAEAAWSRCRVKTEQEREYSLSVMDLPSSSLGFGQSLITLQWRLKFVVLVRQFPHLLT